MSPIAAALDASSMEAVATVAASPAVGPVQCTLASHELRIQEELLEADAVLADEMWRWVRDLTDAMEDSATRTQSKVFFLRLLRASDSAAVEAVLGDMEAWRTAHEDEKSPREERQGLQALFLLGVDKHMSLARCP